MAEDGHKVSLNIYDLSQGMARQLSATFLGKDIEAIWHTGIVVYDNEYYFGGGIQHDPVGRTPYGKPLRVVDLGVTHVPKDVFEMYLQEIGPRYTAETYSLLSHNCNNFSNEVAQFLVGATIPDYILHLPTEVLSSPMGAFILPMIQQVETTLKSGAVPQARQFTPVIIPGAETSWSVTAPPTSRNNNIGDTVSKKTADRPLQHQDLNTLAKAVPLAVKSSGVQEALSIATEDPLGDARSKVQEEIGREFAAIMATGTVRASEAAALATRRVMQRYGHMDVAMPQS